MHTLDGVMIAYILQTQSRSLNYHICTAQFLQNLRRFVIKMTAIKISSKNVLVTCSKYWYKCDGKYSLCISDHEVDFHYPVHSTAMPLLFRLHTSSHTLLHIIIYLLFSLLILCKPTYNQFSYHSPFLHPTTFTSTLYTKQSYSIVSHRNPANQQSNSQSSRHDFSTRFWSPDPLCYNMQNCTSRHPSLFIARIINISSTNYGCKSKSYSHILNLNT